MHEASFDTDLRDRADGANDIDARVKEFLDRVIVRILVERLSETKGHLPLSDAA